MKAMVLASFHGELKVQEVLKPEPLGQEVLIHVAYAGVNPVDWKIREGYLQDRLPHDFPLILGWDVSGIVVAVGEKVQNLKVGDEVYAYVRKPLVKWGSFAEYVAFDAKDVVKKPKSLSLAQAAGLPLVSLTAWQSLFNALHLKKGETILIQGGSGGVGSMAIQFAKNIGAKVLVTASCKKHAYVKTLGADFALDYGEDVVSRVKEYALQGVDAVFDCHGGESFKEGISCLKKGGRIVSILENLDPQQAHKMGIQAYYVFVTPSGKDLAAIKDLVEQGKVVPPHIEEMSIREASSALNKLRDGAVFGKIVLKILF